MNNLTDSSSQIPLPRAFPTFWERIVNDEELRHRPNLEKLLTGCEIIVALDGIDLIAA